MKTQDQLKIIKQLSELTQEKLAQKLAVSFATLNSWINGKSKPRKAALERIEQLYRDYTGQKKIPLKIVDAKREMINSYKRKHKGVLSILKKRNDLLEQFMLSFTYNSNSIEGNTLTEPQTAAILFDDAVIKNKALREHLEVKNHQTALSYLLEYMFKGKDINEKLILKLHSILMNGIQHDAGIYRNHSVRIVGAFIPTANYHKISELMRQLLRDIKKRRKDILFHIALIHSRFEKIHPFSDGNGRIGRLLLNAMLLKNDISPAIIKQKCKKTYYKALNRSQLKEDHNLLYDFICDAVIEGYKMYSSDTSIVPPKYR